MLRSLVSKLAGAILPLLAATPASLAVDPQQPPSTPIVSNAGGLAVSLTTSGYLFEIPANPTNNKNNRSGTARPIKNATDAFAASAIVQNRGRADVTFTFPDAASAAVKWTFRIFDKEGTALWTSDDDTVGAQVLTDVTLGRGQRWKRDIRVPLKINDIPLPSGIYTLEASIDADKQLGASAVFEVVSKTTPAPPPEPASGIDGLVTKPAPASIDPDAPKTVPAAGAVISINEIILTASPIARTPFNWIGRADADGKFHVPTPAGRFRVTASISNTTPTPDGAIGGIIAPPIIPSKSVEVTVEAGKFSQVEIDLVAIKPPPPPPPPTEQGIKGAVVWTSATAAGTADTPVANASVSVESLAANAAALPVFRWLGHTDAEGHFAVQTPAGRYRVTVTEPLRSNTPTAVSPSTVTETITVEPSQYAEPILRLKRTR